ncbi:MAG: 1-deoxy-D-xylulose-5-phosphate synthase [Ruminococcaceae bacterium]|nr:1-deoxy-D-xylulose-5-phosphate synthase [Oscillospiraceae bacterium]
MGYLENINNPSDLKKLNNEQLDVLAKEIRERIIDTVSENGGHLASNLGVVELTLALHRVFDLPSDSIIFDVGHQCYTHKLLTGRQNIFPTLRKQNGMSGFTNRFESKYDAFGAGHSGTSISAALGIACANKLKGNNAYSIAVVGDGSFTNGMIYEALNNCSGDTPNLIVVLNDNEMSISKNVGAMSSYLSSFSNSKAYINFKNKTYAFCLKTKSFGTVILGVGRFIKNVVKKLLMNKNYFECLGLKYYGPIDGHDEELLELVLEQAKKRKRPCVVHVVTKKGKGYKFAEERADIFHSVGQFDKNSGETSPAKYDYSAAFGDCLTEIADKDNRVVAITAAMGNGTGLTRFEEKHSERFFDVGIAEEHALTFAAGLAAMGKKAVFAVYSSFLQRCYDQIIHDVAIQKLPVVLAIDRAGLVSGDGMTHQGIYDSSFLMGIPNFEVYAPENYAELKETLKKAVDSDKPCAVRYPKGCETLYDSCFENQDDYCVADLVNGEKNVVIITYGKVTYNVYEAAKKLSDSCNVRIIKLKKIKPIPYECIYDLCSAYENIFVIEEGIRSGGVGENIASYFNKYKKEVFVHAINAEESFSGNADELYDYFGFTAEKISKMISEKIK